ncbi:uncharacterized protein BDR25DRAFT_362434 [Lindgomyces ingoldianus]|uniref:Uncharacterized protein n=1 Tax=Lindgomyces ingoldianus TaxID=673940 RepID=A0ACB6QBK9_9PLEO|nr:uncharacterized protein BDR25DRAFT_362434 [Lindgomyces ingoldianus]KAF2463767.1 hypothetical protein BDR25DRAFT_362434 [Lindgomyces ingoldianus]
MSQASSLYKQIVYDIEILAACTLINVAFAKSSNRRTREVKHGETTSTHPSSLAQATELRDRSKCKWSRESRDAKIFGPRIGSDSGSTLARLWLDSGSTLTRPGPDSALPLLYPYSSMYLVAPRPCSKSPRTPICL